MSSLQAEKGAEASTAPSPPQTAYLTVDNKDADPSTSERTSVSGVTLDPIDAEKANAPEAPQDAVRKVQGWRWYLVVLSMLSSIFLFSLDNTIVADIQHAVVEDFHDISKLPWLSGAFLIGAAATNLVWGKVYAGFEAKSMYIACVILFEAGSALCGGAPSMNALIVGRAIAGVGGSGLYIGVMTLISVTTTIHERPLYVGLTGLVWGIGTVLGPIVGGAFTDSSAGWRWAFYINLFIGAAFAPVWIFMLPASDPSKGTPYKKRIGEIDWTGTIIIVGAFVSGIMGISFGGILYAWNSWQIITSFVVSGVLFIVLGFQQGLKIWTTAEHRIFPVQFLKDKTMVLLCILIACGGTGVIVPLYMIPLFFQFTQGDRALEAGVRILPFIALMVFFCIVNGAAMSKWGYYMPWYLFGGILLVIGGALMYTVGWTDGASKVYGYTILIGIGAGSFIQAGFSVAQAKVPEHDIPWAVGFISSGQITGLTISISIANSVFLNGAQDRISKILPDLPAEDVQRAIAGTGSAFVKSLPDEVRNQVLNAIVEAMSKTYILIIAAGALAVVCSLGLKRERLFLTPGVGA